MSPQDERRLLRLALVHGTLQVVYAHGRPAIVALGAGCELVTDEEPTSAVLGLLRDDPAWVGITRLVVVGPDAHAGPLDAAIARGDLECGAVVPRLDSFTLDMVAVFACHDDDDEPRI